MHAPLNGIKSTYLGFQQPERGVWRVVKTHSKHWPDFLPQHPEPERNSEKQQQYLLRCGAKIRKLDSGRLTHKYFTRLGLPSFIFRVISLHRIETSNWVSFSIYTEITTEAVLKLMLCSHGIGQTARDTMWMAKDKTIWRNVRTENETHNDDELLWWCCIVYKNGIK